MGTLVISGGRVCDPGQGLDREADLLICDGKVAGLAPSGRGEAAAREQGGRGAVEVIDAAGCLVLPGLVDMHVHLREPGMEEEETIASGAAAAVAGGFTSIACMPNTEPPLDSEAALTFVRSEAAKADLANVFPVGCITVGRRGEELAEMAQMARGGAVAFSDDGDCVPAAGLLRRAMSYAAMLGLPVLEHCEDASLAAGGDMHEGYACTVLGLAGIPPQAEEVMVARDIALAELTGCRLHVQHVSTAGSVKLIEQAKQRGVRVTAEVTPHHLVLTDDCVRGYDPCYKVNPPLRGEADVRACVRGLAAGVIDAVASDHAPHLVEEKEVQFGDAPCGVLGMETSLGVLLTCLLHNGSVELSRLVEAMASAPAGILGLGEGRGGLGVGAVADVTVVDPDLEWTVDPRVFRSKSRNCPFAGRRLRGRALYTVVGGEVKYRLRAGDREPAAAGGGDGREVHTG